MFRERLKGSIISKCGKYFLDKVKEVPSLQAFPRFLNMLIYISLPKEEMLPAALADPFSVSTIHTLSSMNGQAALMSEASILRNFLKCETTETM